MARTFSDTSTDALHWITQKIEVSDRDVFYRSLLKWGKELKTFFAFDSAGHYDGNLSRFDWLVLADEYRRVSEEDFLNRPLGKKGEWLGFLISYDFYECIYGGQCTGEKLIYAKPAGFFEPNWVFYQSNGAVYASFRAGFSEAFEKLMISINENISTDSSLSRPPEFKAETSRQQYLSNFEVIRKHLYRGDIYEVNYCVFYRAEGKYDWYSYWMEYMSRSSGPMGGLFKMGNVAVYSKSPERFFAFRNGRLYSQPIKGTVKRSHDQAEDQLLREILLNSQKERSENVMIVDLVRNDLSRVCEVGSVRVDELFGIYSFAKVHQMISTVSGVPRETLTMAEVMNALFPMGSMTGAPKISAMNIIRSLESHDRGYYSGTAGYIAPDGEVDCNVIIRSIVADQEVGKAYIGVGSAVTIYTSGEEEYNECLLKLHSVIQ